MINLLESKDLLYLKTRLVNHETKHRCKKKEGKREWVLKFFFFDGKKGGRGRPFVTNPPGHDLIGAPPR